MISISSLITIVTWVYPATITFDLTFRLDCSYPITIDWCDPTVVTTSDYYEQPPNDAN